jgi:6-phosphogluconate dehydrogenase
MQLIAEAFDILQRSLDMNYDQLADVSDSTVLALQNQMFRFSTNGMKRNLTHS